MEQSGGRDMLDVLALPERERQLVQWLLRRGAAAGVSEVAAATGQGEEAARRSLDALTGEGFLERTGGECEARWRARLAVRRGRRVSGDIWKRLDE